MLKQILMGASALAVVSACTAAPPQSDTAEVPTETVAETVVEAEAQGAVEKTERVVKTTARDYWGDFGIDQTAMDTSIRPGDDFYRYGNGAWMDAFEIPADRSRYGAFTLLAEKSEQRVRFIIEDLAAEKPGTETVEGKVAAYFNAYMDLDAIEAAGLAPAQPYLDQIAAIKTREDLARVMAATGFTSPVTGFVNIDAKQTDRYIFYFGSGGLGLPNKDYYFDTDEKTSEIRNKYVDYVTTLLEMAGYEDAERGAALVMSLETEIAKSHWDRVLNRKPALTYNLVSAEEFQSMGAGFPVAVFLEELGLGGEAEFVVSQLYPTDEEIAEAGLTEEQIEGLAKGVPGIFESMQTAPLESWKAYLTAHFISDHASVLPKAVDDARFDFYSRTLRGQEEQRERWKRAVGSVSGTLGEAVGKVYVERHFPPEHKAAMDDLVANLRKAMAQNLDNLEWMGDETKVEARSKLASFEPLVGYPANFETYDGMVVSETSAFANRMSTSEWGFKDMISQLGEPIDRTQWFMTPQQVNAYYSPTRNQIVFPAAILQPPFFNASADPAVNYGAIGGVIGHEMGHGFDDQGSKYDGTGLLRDWWTAEDQANFKARTEALAAQYDQFCPFEDEPEVCVNGNNALGENIGDLGGLSMAYTAYKLSLNGEEAPVLNGLTGDQRFFLAWAQVWRALYRDEALRQQIVGGSPHSPPYYRVNGVVRNMDAWYEAFGVEPGDEMYLPPEERIGIW